MLGPGRKLPPGKTRYPLYRRLGGTQGWSGRVRKISPPPGFDPRTVQPVGSSYNDYANRPTITKCTKPKVRGCYCVPIYPLSYLVQINLSVRHLRPSGYFVHRQVRRSNLLCSVHRVQLWFCVWLSERRTCTILCSVQ